MRKFLSYLPSNNIENLPYVQTVDDSARMDEDLNHLVSLDPSEPYLMHQVIESVLDRGTFFEIQPQWARSVIVGLARIGGHSVGIVAQEPAVMAGVIDIDASDKRGSLASLARSSWRLYSVFRSTKRLQLVSLAPLTAQPPFS